ncbi:uncharacterized protein B0P05DRAFT_589499 [Gilbertella persicaria]|uniref:uncharacterized protein n=1 Tax=Gilbertella persicaria TaxID=101096 RepID=UPI002221185F|nr:uncharacterized protein B0P05DRAFT_589499 [Gilbertella persicaria]KAI8068137.1 hypothetical protein B0P05DRAFT_589499 [Gilbertella persicaria]
MITELSLYRSMPVDWITQEEFQSLVKAVKKKHRKAILSLNTAIDIVKIVEQGKRQCHLGTAAYRYWVRRRFMLHQESGHQVLCTRTVDGMAGLPVCLEEELFFILTKAHAQHGSVNTTKMRSYIPKELCNLLVKACSQCNSIEAIIDLYT